MNFGIKQKIGTVGLGALLLVLGLSACKQTTNPASAIAPFAPFTPTATPTGTTTPIVTATNTGTATGTASPTNTPASTSTPVTVYLLGTATFTATNSPTSTVTVTPTVTWTPCVSSSSFGISITGSDPNGSYSSGFLFAILYNYPSATTGTLRDIQAYTSQASTIILQGGIYSGNSTQPLSLLGSSDSVTTAGAGWYIFPIPGNISLEPGGSYWLCLNNYWPNPSSSTYGAGYQTDGDSSQGSLITTDNVSLFPNSWPTSGNAPLSNSLPIFADYCQ